MSKKRTAARRFAGLFMPALIVLLLAGCGGGEDPTPAPVAVAPAAVAEQPAAPATVAAPEEAAVAAAPAAASTSGGAMDDLMAAFQAQRSALPVRVSFRDGSANETFQLEVESPTRANMLMDDMEIVIYDGTVYMKEDGEWTDGSMMAGIAQSLLTAYVPDVVDEAFTSVASVEQIDDGEVNGEAVNVYRVVAIEDEDDVADVDEGVVLFHVRKSDGLLVRMSTEADAAEQFTVDYEYDGAIRVEVPAL